MLYNAVGGTENNGVFELRYEERNRLDYVTVGALRTSYGVNGLGERVAKDGQQSFGKVEFFYELSGRLLGQYNASGAATEEIVWLGDLPVATLQGGAAYMIAPDHLGAPHQIINPAKTQVWLWDHDPFGNGAPAAAAGFSHRLRFPGQVYDAETGLHSNGQRNYDPRLGRYVESDPIGLAGGINSYAYAGDDPVNGIDPLGLRDHPLHDPEEMPPIDIAAEQALHANATALPTIDIGGQQVAQNVTFHDINPVLIDAGIVGIALPPRKFESIVGKHGPNTNRPFPTSKFYPQFVSNRDSFVRLILQPVLGGPSTPLITPFGVPGQLNITTDLGNAVGTDLFGQPTSMVTIRVAPDSLGYYIVTGAFPK